MNFFSRGLLAAAFLPLAAQAVPQRVGHVEAELAAERSAWLAGAANEVALRLVPDAGWHVYWRNPGDSGLATTLHWTLPPGWSAGDIEWPYPEMQRQGELVNYGYSEETLHLVAITVPRKAGDSASIAAEAKWLVCSDVCIPGKADLTLTLPVKDVATSDPAWAPRFERARQRLPQASPASGRFQVAGREFRLRVPLPAAALAAATAAEFFPYAPDLVNHGAAQRVALEADSVRFAQPISSYYVKPPATAEGVVVLHGARTEAYAISSQPGDVQAVTGTRPSGAAAGESEGLPLILLLALAGGLILNLMPCVFPVLSLKAISVLESRGAAREQQRAHALAYTAGVVGSWVGIALLLLVLRRGGQALGWGFQLQSPVFVAWLAYLMFALGLSLSGVVTFGTRMMGMGQALTERGGTAGSFFTGLLATVVATPCVAPFMGTALAYAMVQPAALALVVFATLGLGMASPFLALGFAPRLAAFLPKPGAWMETFRQVMAFPLYLTSVWLVWVIGRQTGADGAALVLAGIVLIAFALWLLGRAQPGRIVSVIAVAAIAAALAVTSHSALRPTMTARASEAGQASGAWSDQKLAELRAEGRIVFVNFTADWCITCKVNERAALSSAAVHDAFTKRNVAWLTADWTNPDPAITAALARFGRSGVPLYLLYPPRGEPVVLPQVLTPDILLDALDRIR